ncbi:MAG: hypothetical protein LH470_04200 [Lysobacter sp.]|nr:hypothetical protein [Lysobacter sp.]
MKTLSGWRTCLAVALLFTALVPQLRAQDEEAEERPVMQLELKPDELMPPGQAAFMQGEADQLGHRFLVEGTALSQPISVAVLTQYPEDKVRVRVVKDDWDVPERDEETGADKKVELTFRTFDGFKLWITAEKPTDYQLVVWVGEPVEAPLPSIAVPASKFVEGQMAAPSRADAELAANVGEKPGKISLSRLELGLIVTLLLLGGAFAAFLLMRRKRTDGSLK